MFSTENVIGSNYDDDLTGPDQGVARGLGGAELCSGFLAADCGGRLGSRHVSLDSPRRSTPDC